MTTQTKPTLRSIIEGNPDTFQKLIFYSVTLFVSSLGTFLLLGSEDFGGKLVSSNKATRDIVAAIGGILVTNIIIAIYVIDAFNEKSDTKELESKKDS